VLTAAKSLRGLLAVLFLAALYESSVAQLQPAELFVIYNRNLPESRSVAMYYAERRGVPKTQLLGLDLPSTEQISRDAYERKVKAPLRSWLAQRRGRETIRCLVTVYGVPLRIGEARPSPADRQLLPRISAELQDTLGEFAEVLRKLEDFVGAAGSRPASRPGKPPPWKKLLDRYRTARALARRRLAETRDLLEAPARGRRLLALLQQAEGDVAVIARLRGRDATGRQWLAGLQAEFARQRRRLQRLLSGCPHSENRPQAHALLKKLYGLKGLIEHLQADEASLRGRETTAALDSELSLLWWDGYPLYRWRLNPMSLRVLHGEDLLGFLDPQQADSPVLMVSRLDASSPRIVRRMIDDALFAERYGLSGNVYIDARGLSRPKQVEESGYWIYDENLRELAALLRRKTHLNVELDDRPALFSEGQCPDAALYCGWYRLGKYLDAFDWVRGAVGYHIASSEAVSLRRPGAQYWCKRMLEDGAAATLGPVAEPYLRSFPLPRDFFGLLLTGRYTLVECFYMTKSFNSWMMILLGDPLYRPFRRAPILSREDVFPADWFTPPAAGTPRF